MYAMKEKKNEINFLELGFLNLIITIIFFLLVYSFSLQTHLKNLSTYRCFLGLSCEIGRGAQGSINVIDIDVGNFLQRCFTDCNAITRWSGGIGWEVAIFLYLIHISVWNDCMGLKVIKHSLRICFIVDHCISNLHYENENIKIFIL